MIGAAANRAISAAPPLRKKIRASAGVAEKHTPPIFAHPPFVSSLLWAMLMVRQTRADDFAGAPRRHGGASHMSDPERRGHAATLTCDCRRQPDSFKPVRSHDWKKKKWKTRKRKKTTKAKNTQRRKKKKTPELTAPPPPVPKYRKIGARVVLSGFRNLKRGGADRGTKTSTSDPGHRHSAAGAPQSGHAPSLCRKKTSGS